MFTIMKNVSKIIAIKTVGGPPCASSCEVPRNNSRTHPEVARTTYDIHNQALDHQIKASGGSWWILDVVGEEESVSHDNGFCNLYWLIDWRHALLVVLVDLASDSGRPFDCSTVRHSRSLCVTIWYCTFGKKCITAFLMILSPFPSLFAGNMFANFQCIFKLNQVWLQAMKLLSPAREYTWIVYLWMSLFSVTCQHHRLTVCSSAGNEQPSQENNFEI